MRRHRCLSYLGVMVGASLLWSSAASGQVLSECTINFESSCPNAGAVCGADFSGGLGCVVEGLGSCYASGVRSYKVTPAAPATITFTGDLLGLEVFFAAQGGTVSGTMVFFDATVGGNELGTLSTNGNCLALMPPSQTIFFAAPARRIEVSASGGTVWIDDFHVSPPPPTCTGVSDCSGNGTCVDTDVCVCDSGWSGVSCDTVTCNGVNNCSGHGTCINPDTCACDVGWLEADCGTPDCSGVADCSSHGTCIDVDTCVCESGWSGVSCDTTTCDAVNNCSGHGTCSGSNTCECDGGYGGPDCAIAVPAVSTWGLLAFSLCLLCAATMVIQRQRQLTAGTLCQTKA